MVLDGVDRVVKTRMTFEVLDVLDRAGREVVNNVDFIATLKISVS
jgi:hypothetical protein